MKIGTRSLLYGAHAFWLHPWFVAYAWWQLYGFPWDPRLWVAFFVHDIGYWGKPNMDGVEGEAHVFPGAIIMHRLFDPRRRWANLELYTPAERFKWYLFCVYHSRFIAAQEGKPPSRLCYADKMAFVNTPWWIYGPMTRWTGEIKEYMWSAQMGGKYHSMQIFNPNPREWHRLGQAWIRKWVEQNKDSWTKIGYVTSATLVDKEGKEVSLGGGVIFTKPYTKEEEDKS